MQLFQFRSFCQHLVLDDVAFRAVTIHWFRDDDEAAPRPFDQVVEEYEQLDPAQRLYTQRYVQELFDADEVEALTQYLVSLDSETLAFDVAQPAHHKLPLVRPIPGTATGLRDIPRGGLARRFSLTSWPGYDLPFRVSGYFHLSEVAPDERWEQAASYLHRALQMLERDAGIKYETLRAIAQTIYERDRVYVTQERTHAAWQERMDVL